MSDSIRQLLSHQNVQARRPCNSTDIDAVDERLQMHIPAAVRVFWEASNGASLPEHDAEMLSTSEVLELFDIDVFGELLLESGFLPLLYDRESNYICAACNEPLAPRIIYVLHDGSPVVLYRNMESFLSGCLDLLASSDFSALFFHKTQGDFGSCEQRTIDDHKAARSLIESGEDWEVSMAIQLLDETCVDEWKGLLNGDRFARQDALIRLKQIGSDASRAILRSDSVEFDAFAAQVCDAAENAGIPVTHNKKDPRCIRVNRRWVDLNAFFGRRHIDNAFPRLVDWLVDIRDGNNPNERPGNFMLD